MLKDKCFDLGAWWFSHPEVVAVGCAKKEPKNVYILATKLFDPYPLPIEWEGRIAIVEIEKDAACAAPEFEEIEF
jgi:hypothetical protein